MNDRYGTRYTSRLSFSEEKTVTPVDVARYVSYHVGDHWVVEPSPPPPPQKKKPKPRDYARERQSKPVERDPGPRELIARSYESLTYEILAGPTFPATSAGFRVFLYELEDKCRVSYKPPPPHWRNFSKMQVTYADDDVRWTHRKPKRKKMTT